MKKQNLISVSVFMMVLLCSVSTLAFDNNKTHPQLTEKAMEYCKERGYSDILSEREVKQITKGSTEEDNGSRWLCHFDPVLPGWPGNTDAKKWAFDDVSAPACTSLISRKNSYKWSDVLNTAKDEDDRRESLGHVLHLLQDMASPAHVRKDPHGLPVIHNDPLEAWAESKYKYISELAIPSEDWKVFDNAKGYFNDLSDFTRKNFYSRDTCFQDGLPGPEMRRQDKEYFYGECFPDYCDGDNRKIAFKGPAYFMSGMECSSRGRCRQVRPNDPTKSIIDNTIAAEQFNELYNKVIVYSASLATHKNGLVSIPPSKLPVARFLFGECPGVIIDSHCVRFYGKPAVPGALYAWDFGDGTEGYGHVVDHRFPDNGGPYDVNLVVTVDGRLVAARTLSFCHQNSYTVEGKVTKGMGDLGTPMADVTMILAKGDITTSTVGEIIRTTTTDSEGNYRFADIQAGTYYWWPDLTGLSLTRDVGAYLDGYSACSQVVAIRVSNFSVCFVSTIAMGPMAGPPGTTFTEWGTGFTPNSTATLHFLKPDGTEYPTRAIDIDSEGHFEITYTAPSDIPFGTYWWWGVDVSGCESQRVSYAITP